MRRRTAPARKAVSRVLSLSSAPPRGHAFAKRRRRHQIQPVSDDSLAMLRSVLVGPPDEEMVALEAEIRAAQLAADVAALDRLIADDLLFAGPDGQLGTKAQDLEAHGSGVIRFRAHEPEELRVRRIGADVAITSLRARLAVELGGRIVRAPIATRACGRARMVEGGASSVVR